MGFSTFDVLQSGFEEAGQKVSLGLSKQLVGTQRFFDGKKWNFHKFIFFLSCLENFENKDRDEKID